MFESPDYNVQTVTPSDGSSPSQADFKNRVYFAKVSFEPYENYTGPIWYVSVNGSDSNLGNNSNPFFTVKKAVDTAASRDTISIGEGSFDIDETIHAGMNSGTAKSLYFVGEGSDKTELILKSTGYEFFFDGKEFDGTMEVGFEKIKFTGSANVIEWTFMLYSGNYIFKQCEFNSIRNSYLHRVQNSRLIIDECTYTNPESDYEIISVIGENDEGNSKITLKNINYNSNKDFNISLPNWTDTLSIENLTVEGTNFYVEDVGYLIASNIDIHDSKCIFECNAGGSITGSKFYNNNLDELKMFTFKEAFDYKIEKSLFYNNISTYGLIFIDGQSTTTIDKCTFAKNLGVLFGIQDESYGVLQNSIVQADTSKYGNNVLWFNGNSNQSFSTKYSLIHFLNNVGWGYPRTEENTIYEDPLFLDVENDDFRLKWGSPAIDAGDPLSSLDPDGTVADMGAIYFDQSDLVVPTVSFSANTTSGEVPLEISFTDNTESSDITQWKWSFGDGSESNEQNPTHTYTSPGKYSVNLEVTNVYGISNNTTITEMIEATDTTPPQITLNSPTSGSVLEIAKNYNIEWSATDNGSVEKIDINYSVDDGLNWSDIATDLINDGTYSWLIPNEPSTSLVLRAIATDFVGLSDTSAIPGLEIEVVYPMIISSSLSKGILTWRDNQLSFTFSVKMDNSSISDEAVTFNSYSGTNIDVKVSFSDSTNTVVLSTMSSFPSHDSITVTLDANAIKSSFGYQLDGDGDGVPGDDYSFSSATAMLADYDTSASINSIDLALFIQGLEEKDAYYELGPVVGSAPHFVSTLDSEYDIEDVMAFVMMWNWYSNTSTTHFTHFTSFGLPITILSTSDSIGIQLPEGVLAYQIQVKYPVGSLIIHNPSGKDDLTLIHNDESSGVFTILVRKGEEKSMSLPVKAMGRGADIKISIRAVGRDGEIISQGTESFHVEGIPEQYTLHQNYPNPFNPTTTILYDVPQDSKVSLYIYDLLGRQIRTLINQDISAGYHEAIWDAKDDMGRSVSGGLYIYRIQAGGFSKTMKMVLLK